MAKGHWENVYVGSNPQTGKPYYERRWIEDHSNELTEGPAPAFPEGSTTTKPAVPVITETVTAGGGGKERFVPTNFIVESARALEAKEDKKDDKK